MVQMSNTLIIAAAVVVPVLSAPLGMDSNALEAREPKGFGTAFEIAGKVASGASLGATVAGAMQQWKQHDLESREPGITSAEIAAAAKIAHYAKTGVEFGATVAPMLPHTTLHKVRGAAAGAAGFAGAVAATNTNPQQRDLEFLEDRRLPVSAATLRRIGSAVAGVAGFTGAVAALNTPPQQREFVDFETRERGKFHGYMKEAPGLIGSEDENMLEARDPKVFGILKKVAGLVLREDETGEVYVARDYDHIDAHEPKFGSSAGLPLREAPEFDALD